MTKQYRDDKIQELLSKQYYCSIEQLNKNDILYSINFDAKQPYIKIVYYKNCIVVCTSEELYAEVKKLLQQKSRDEIFEFPLVYGQTIHYVPNNYDIHYNIDSKEYDFELLFDKEVLTLNGLTGFENSLVFDVDGFTATKAVFIAKHHKKIIGIAGASESSVKNVWEIGIDVTEKYRNKRLGSSLVSGLTRELLKRNIVPFYSASVTNIASQMVAAICGYVPLWVDTFGTILDGSSVYHDIVSKLTLHFTK